MIRSMTGFGDASIEAGGMHYALELRSLNNKYFKALVRVPEELSLLEAELESALRKKVHRGSFTVTLKTRAVPTSAVSQINDTVLLSYIDHLEAIRHKVRDQTIHIDLTQLLALPGVIQDAEDPAAAVDTCRPIVMKLLDQAVVKLDAMRTAEGRGLAEVLAQQLAVIRARLAIVRERAPVVVQEYQEKLRSRMRELMATAELSVSEPDVIKEVAVFADRVDVHEEAQRIEAHLDQFAAKLDGDEADPAGRTLDFIAQELLREANTVAAKSSDAAVSRAVVEIKSAIDRIKEQVQNVE